MADYDLTSIIGAEDADAMAQARAMAAALRNDRSLGMLGALAGGKTLGRLSPVLLEQAHQGEQLLNQALTAREHYRPQAEERLAKSRAMANPATRQFFVKKMGEMDPGTDYSQMPVEQLATLFPNALKYSEARAARDEATKRAQLLNDQRNAFHRAEADARASSKDEKDNESVGQKWVDSLRQAVMSSRGVGGQAQQTLNRADRSLALLANNQDTPQAWADFAAGLASVSGGGAAHEALIKAVKPDGVNFSLAALKQYVTGQPAPVGAKSWMDYYRNVFKQEEKTLRGQVADAAFKASVPYAGWMSQERNRKRAQAVLKAHGIENRFDPETFTPVFGEPEVADAGMSQEDAAAMQWLQQNQGHPSAGKVAAKLKAKGLLR